jgi:hypothetical protein
MLMDLAHSPNILPISGLRSLNGDSFLLQSPLVQMIILGSSDFDASVETPRGKNDRPDDLPL